MVLEVSAAVIVEGDCVLLARRAMGKREAGKWEFPGGKRENGETLKACLKRELQEELGVNACVGKEIIRTEYSYPHSLVRLIAFQTVLEGPPVLSSDHDRLAWVPLTQILLLDLSPADLSIARHLIRHQVEFIKTASHLD